MEKETTMAEKKFDKGVPDPRVPITLRQPDFEIPPAQPEPVRAAKAPVTGVGE